MGVMEALTLVAALTGAVTGIWAVHKIFDEVRRPRLDLKERVDGHDRMLANDNERMKDFKVSNDLQMKMLLQLANHAIDGNHVDKLIAVRDEVQNYLIER